MFELITIAVLARNRAEVLKNQPVYGENVVKQMR
jgi:hypothetical protein